MSRRCPSCGTEFPDEVAFCGNDGILTLQVQPPDDVDARIGQTFGAYMIVGRVADGAMGRVYEARKIENRERVAIKVLHADVAKDAVAVERFKRESETAQALHHPNVVNVVDFGETGDGSWFMTMEYLQGEELGQLLRREKTVGAPRVVRIMSQLGVALEHAHSFGVIHRDLKPDNVFLCESADGDVVKVLDFGSVKLQMEMGPKLTAFGTTLGSPFYMSPEQAMGKQDVDGRTDLFAMGAILYEMLCGKVAFDAPNVAGILMKIMNEQPQAASAIKPGVLPTLDAVVTRSIAKDKLQRYASTRDLAQAVIGAYGLHGTVADFAAMPTATIAQRLSQVPASAAATVPDSFPPYGMGGTSGSPPKIRAVDSQFPSEAPAMARARPMPGGMLVGVGVLALLVLVGCAVAFFLR